MAGWDWQYVCGQNSSSFQFVEDHWLSDCAEQLLVICPAYILQAVTCMVVIGRRWSQAGWHHRYIKKLVKIRYLCSSLLIILPVLEFCLILLLYNRTLPPVEIIAGTVVIVSWILHVGALYKMRHVVSVNGCYPIMLTLCWLLTFLVSVMKFVSVILNDSIIFSATYMDHVNSVKRYTIYTELGIQCLYLLLIVIGAINASQDFELDHVLNAEYSETRPILSEHIPSYQTLSGSQESEDELLGVAAYNSSCISRLFFWWARSLMVKGYKGKLSSHTDLFDLPSTVATANVVNTFKKNYKAGGLEPVHDSQVLSVPYKYSINYGTTLSTDQHSTDGCCDAWNLPDVTKKPEKAVSLLRALHRSFGLEYYSIGLLKFLGDGCGFIGPILLHQLVSFMENKDEPVKNGYLYAIGLLGSTLLSAMFSVHFNYR